MENDQSSTRNARRRSASVAQLLGGESQSGITSIGGPATSLTKDIEDIENRQTHTASGTRDSSSDWEMNEMFSDDNLDDDEETGLTNGDKKQRRKRKRRNTLLDGRIANVDAKALEEKIAVQSFWRQASVNGLLIGLWYTFSISISVVSLEWTSDTSHSLRVVSSINGFCRRTTSTSTFHYSSPAFTWSSNFS